MELCTHEKAVFFLPVNILTVWSLAFLAASDISCFGCQLLLFTCFTAKVFFGNHSQL